MTGTPLPPAVTGTPLPPCAPAHPRRPTLVSSVDGRITHLLLGCPGWLVRREPDLATNLIAAAPEDARVTVVTHAGSRAALERHLAATGRSAEIVSLPDHGAVPLWMQDAFLADARATDPLAAALDRLQPPPDERAAPARPLLPGGNVLVLSDRLLVGRDDWDAAARRLAGPSAPAEAADALLRDHVARTVDPRPVLVVGLAVPITRDRTAVRRGPDGAVVVDPYPGVTLARSFQPIYHLDLMITPAGRRGPGAPDRLLVADARLGAEICGTRPPPGPVTRGFDEIAATLRGEGFEVLRVPLVVVPDARPVRARQMIASWNNCWVEATVGAGGRVTLPSFAGWQPGLVRADDHVARMWLDMAFSTSGLDVGVGLARHGGGLHCAGKVLARGG